jgi:hypothetical protein
MGFICRHSTTPNLSLDTEWEAETLQGDGRGGISGYEGSPPFQMGFGDMLQSELRQVFLDPVKFLFADLASGVTLPDYGHRTVSSVGWP